MSYLCLPCEQWFEDDPEFRSHLTDFHRVTCMECDRPAASGSALCDSCRVREATLDLRAGGF